MYGNVDDLTQLKQLDSDSVKKCLHMRYKQNIFYTWAGPTLVALNPLRSIPELYSKETMHLFAHETFTYSRPHIFSLGQRSLRHLQWGLGKTHQAIVVNGESGAGKTCSALYLLSYLAAMETNNNNVGSSSNIEVLLCKSNPLLEALGNAQTLRNENSSRFGKLIRLLYRGEGVETELVSANIETYLLESTRVARQASGERNFHIFYQMLCGLPNDVKEDLGLLDESIDWKIASNSDCHPLDETEFKSTLSALSQLNLSGVAQDLWNLLAAVLHLGNINFQPLEQSGWTTDQMDHVRWAALLLQVPADELFHVFTVRYIQAGSTTPVVRPCSTESECSARRDTLIRLLYRLMFDMVLERVNQKLQNSIDSTKTKLKYLCILDLYGFESFEHGNSLEQLCINYANERLQYYFTIHYLKDQQSQLANEGLSSIDLDFNVTDKQNLISFLDGPVSVFGVLNEECYLNRGCDDSQVCIRIQSSLNERTKGMKSMPQSPRIPRTNHKTPPVQFAISHYAGLVSYSTVSMLDKNRDHVPGELLTLFLKSGAPFVRQLVSREITAASHTMNGRRHTVLAKFKSSLDSLMKTLNSCDVHYVRCIRPSESSSATPRRWDDDYVDAQLNACGVIDTIKVSSFGFPIRMSHEEFATRYKFLVGTRSRGDEDPLELCRRIVSTYAKMGEDIRVGNGQVYATEHGVEMAEQWKNYVRGQAASVIQTWWREHLRRKRAAILIQCWWKRTLQIRAAVRLQMWWRKKRDNRRMLSNLSRMCRSVRIIQRAARRWIEINKKTNYPTTLPKPVENVEEPLIVVTATPNKPVNRNPSGPLGLISLQLSRTHFFYSDGVISMRRPTAVRPRFITRKTCLPYSYVVPRSQLPSGLTDAF